MPIGTPSKDSPFSGTGTFVPHVIVRNLTAAEQAVTITVEYPGEDGPAQAALPPLPLEAYTTKDIPLDSLPGSLPLPLPFCSIRIQYSGSPGSVIGEVSSIETKGDLVIDSRLANELDGWVGSGAHPWHLDEETESILFLTNMSEKSARIGFDMVAGGIHYYLTRLKLKPHETRAIDLRKVRDEQKPDLKRNKVPAGASDGSVVWIRLDHVPVMGRLVVLQRHKSMASSYDCYICDCPADYVHLDVVPSGYILLPNESAVFDAVAWFREHCDGYEWWDYADASWMSLNPSVATIDEWGTVTGQTGGTASIKAIYGDFFYTYDSYEMDCIPHPRALAAAATAKVCDLTITSPADGQVFDLGGVSYNSATVPLAAQSACSGTANWTLSFSYTSAWGITYPGSGSTSTTLNPIGNYQTTNYQTPVGNGGQINLTAQATLAGHSVTKSKTIYVDGTEIPNPTIFTRLASLYSGATPLLLKGTCFKESNYHQFVLRSLYLVPNGRWPIENAANEYTPAGKFVGLMQIPNGMNNAFDWLTNTQQGAIIFQGYLTWANNYVANLQSQYPQLPGLNVLELENEALSKYGGFSTRYYTVNASGNGWVITTRQDLLEYVSVIRANSQ